MGFWPQFLVKMTKQMKKSEMKMDKNHKRLIELSEFVLVTFMPLWQNTLQKLCAERNYWQTQSTEPNLQRLSPSWRVSHLLKASQASEEAQLPGDHAFKTWMKLWETVQIEIITALERRLRSWNWSDRFKKAQDSGKHSWVVAHNLGRHQAALQVCNMGVVRSVRRGKSEGTRMLIIVLLHLHVVEMSLMQLSKVRG